METLSQCIYAWMQAEDITGSQLSEMLGYKSRTSLSRLLHGKSNLHSCEQFCDRIAPYLDKYWEGRFRQALRAEKIGLKRFALLQAMHQCLFEGSRVSRCSSHIMGSIPFSAGTVFVFGCARSGSFSFIDELLASSNRLQVIHYFTRRDLFDTPELLPGLIDHVVSMNYSAILLEEEALYSASLPWNIALWADHRQPYLLFLNDDEGSWHPLSGGNTLVQRIIRSLGALPSTSLYRYEHLQTGKDYIDFTQQNYRMEYNRKALIIKPTPGMQMLPSDIVERTFTDFLADNLQPIAAARGTLVYIFERRVKNFYSRSKPTYLVFSLESMLRFAREGVLEDQFFACRPFTEGERIKIIQMLQAFFRKEDVFVSFLGRGSWPVSVEVYDGQGVLFYPSSSNYNASQSDYRELFLPGQEYADLLFQYVSEYHFFDHSSQNSTVDICEKLLSTVKAASKSR